MIGARALTPNQYTSIDTSKAVELIKSGQVKSAKVIDGEQQLELELANPVDGKTKVMAYYVQPRGDEIVRLLDENPPPSGYDDSVPQPSWVSTLLISLLPILLLVGLFWFVMGQMQGGGSRVMKFGKSKAKLVSKDTPKVTFADVAGADEAVEELRGDQGVPRRAGQVPGRRREDPQGRAALRPARYRQDAAGQGGGRRGRRAVLLDLRVGLRRDVRRRRRQPGSRPVRAGQGERAGHRLRRRDRRRRPAPRRRPGRRPRRARADPQPAAGRDGRLRRQGRRDPDRRHQPPRHPRPGAAAAGPVRPPDRRRCARHGRPGTDPAGARQGQADGAVRRPAGGGPPHPRLHRRRPGQRAQRGGPADGARRGPADRRSRARRGDRPGGRRPAEAQPDHDREGEEDHRLPRGRARPGGGGVAAHRPGRPR